MIQLTELERDVINESFNIGIGQAASALSQMLQHEIKLSLPQIDVLTPDEITGSLEKRDMSVSGVCEKFDGPFSGYALLLFPETQSRDLVRLIYAQHLPDKQVEEIKQDALVEAGNILLNACLASMSELFGKEVSNQIPEAVEGDIKQILEQQNHQHESGKHLIKLNIDFHVFKADIDGNISFLMEINSLEEFRKQLSRRFEIN